MRQSEPQNYEACQDARRELEKTEDEDEDDSEVERKR